MRAVELNDLDIYQPPPLRAAERKWLPPTVIMGALALIVAVLVVASKAN